MTIALTISVALFGMFLDWMTYRRICEYSRSKLIKYSFLSIASISYLLILFTPVFMYFFINEDNSCHMMKLSMIFLTTFLALTIPRQLFCALWLPVSSSRCWTFASALLSSALFIFFLYSVSVTRIDYQIKEIKVPYCNLPDEFNGYRIAFISDIHTGSMVDPIKETSDIIKTVNSTGADIVLLGGDMINIHHSEITDSLVVLYSRLKARDGVFMVLGNHDTGAYIKDSDKAKREANSAALESKMERAGVGVLKDSTVYIGRGTSCIAVTGIDYNEKLLEYKHSMDAVKGVDFSSIYDNLPDSVFNITVSHLPQLWHALCDAGYSDLTLSGHVHAMQMKIASFSPAMFMYDEWSGLYEKGNRRLYVNDGIGCVGYLARFGARPEITVIELCKD